MSPIDSISGVSNASNINPTESSTQQIDIEKLQSLFNEEIKDKFSHVSAEVEKLKLMIDNLDKEEPSNILNHSANTLESLADAFKASMSNESEMTVDQKQMLGHLSKHFTGVIFNIQNVAREMSQLQKDLGNTNAEIKKELEK